MARGAEGKLRRRNEKKQARKDEAEALDMLNSNENPFMAPIEDDDSAEEETPVPKSEGGSDVPPPKKSKSSKLTMPVGVPQKKKEGIKTLPLILLILLTGTAVLPALIYAGDMLGAMMQKQSVLGTIGYKLGLGPTPKKRVLSFYEKHDPAKIDNVDKILAKHYGSYPKLIKQLERKYGDYGYFLEWERDEAPLTLALEHVADVREYLGEQFNLYAPQIVKTAVRNIRYNLSTLYKKGRKIWKKHVWPLIEPVFGVPKGTAAQKRKDAQGARNRKAGGSGTRRKNKDFRDDDAEDED
jgi:hypothetical protein